MQRYYTRVCNFYYGSVSRYLIKKKKSIPLGNNKEISFDQIELISRNSRKKIPLKKLNSLPKSQIKKIKFDLKKISSKKKTFQNSIFLNYPILWVF